MLLLVCAVLFRKFAITSATNFLIYCFTRAKHFINNVNFLVINFISNKIIEHQTHKQKMISLKKISILFYYNTINI